MRKPRLHKDWKRIVTKAWSIRLITLAGLLSGCEIILPLFVDAIPRNTFAVLSFFATAGAFGARIWAQKNMEDSD